MTHIAAIQLSVVCQRCNARCPVVRFADERTCSACGTSAAGTFALIEDAVGRESREAQGYLQNFERTGTLTDHEQMMLEALLGADLFAGPPETIANVGGMRVTRVGCEVCCDACSTAVPVTDALLDAEQLACACGNRLPIRALPSELSQLGWLVTHVIDEAASAFPTQSAETRVFSCGHCGAALRATAGSALVECSYCHATTSLPPHATRSAKARTLYLATTETRRAATHGALVAARDSLCRAEAAENARGERIYSKAKVVYFALSALGLLALFYVLFFKNKG